MNAKYTIFIIVLLTSCSFSERSNNILKDKRNTDMDVAKLKSIALDSDSIIWGFVIEDFFENYFIVLEINNNDCYSIYDLVGTNLKYKGSFLKKGNGPNEMMHPSCFSDDKLFFVYDYNSMVKSIVTIPHDEICNFFDASIWNKIEMPKMNQYLIFPSLSKMNDSIFVIAGSKINENNILSSINIDAMEINKLKYLIPLEDNFNTSNIAKQMVYCDAKIMRQPRGNKLLYICNSGRFSKILSFVNNEVSKETSLLNIYPKYFSKDGYNIHFENECLRGMLAKVTQNKIYLMEIPLTKEDIKIQKQYKGFPNYFNDELYVYDWDGNLLKKYILDIPICSFAIDEKNNCFYGMTINLENGDNVMRKFNFE